MIVVSMTNCPPKLRGDLSKWLLEINTGVYVGQVSARVRDALWKRICENIGSGQATMVFSANNEQHMDFYVHNTTWKPVDFDGIKLMKHPGAVSASAGTEQSGGFSNAARQRMNKKRRRNTAVTSYILLDIETAGLSYEESEILEIGMVEISAGKNIGQYSYLINVEEIPVAVKKLTGIDIQLVRNEGGDLKTALEKTFDMIEERNVLLYNADFDLGFLKQNAEKCGLEFPYIDKIDVMELAQKKLPNAKNYRLQTVAHHLGIEVKQSHRAVEDCLLMNEVFLKLNEIQHSLEVK